MRKLLKAAFLMAFALGLASTLAASTHQQATNEAVGWFGLYGASGEGEEPITPFLPLPECGYCGRGKSDR